MHNVVRWMGISFLWKHLRELTTFILELGMQISFRMNIVREDIDPFEVGTIVVKALPPYLCREEEPV